MPWRHVLGKRDVRGKQRPPLWGRAVEAEGCAGMSEEASGDSPFLPAITSSSSIKKWSPDAILAHGEWPPLFSGHDSQLRKAECEKAVPAPARIVVGRPSSQPGSSRRPRLLLGAPVCFSGSCKGRGGVDGGCHLLQEVHLVSTGCGRLFSSDWPRQSSCSPGTMPALF